jgi:hypothetical protein
MKGAPPVELKGPLTWVEARGIEPWTSCLQLAAESALVVVESSGLFWCVSCSVDSAIVAVLIWSTDSDGISTRKPRGRGQGMTSASEETEASLPSAVRSLPEVLGGNLRSEAEGGGRRFQLGEAALKRWSLV